MALTGGHLNAIDTDDDNTHDFGSHFSINHKTGQQLLQNRLEISNIQNCPYPSCPTSNIKVQGTDHGGAFTNGSVYGNYAIYVSKDAQRFPICQTKLMLQISQW